MTGLLIGAIYALVALGYTMVYGVLKLINFAHGEVFMLGAYAALLVSWKLGYTPNNALTHGSWGVLALMFLGAMIACTIVGVLIERLAYRPMRSQPRLASLITAIGLSLFMQYGGQIFLLNGEPQSIDAKVSPFYSSDPTASNATFYLKPPAAGTIEKAQALQPQVTAAKEAFEAELKIEGGNQFNLSPKGLQLRDEARRIEREMIDAQAAADSTAISVVVPKGQLLMLGMVIVLMACLTYLVLFTKQGRAMRAVSLDFDSAALMGINVNSIITFTFMLGSSLAGAGAMMSATFQSGSKIDTFFGAQWGVKAFVAAVLGGIGNIPGAVLGGLLMGIAENAVVWAGYPGYKDAIAFVVLISVLMFRPGGLLGSSKVEKV